jgi:hypothetical protein
MDVQIPETLGGLEEASRELDAMMAADGGSATGQAGAEGGDKGTQAGDESAKTEAAARAAAAGTEGGQGKVNDESAGKAEGGKQKAETPGEAKDAKKSDEKPDGKSRYAKAQERQQRSWEEVNAQKDALKSEREAFAKEREQFQREREAHQQERTKAENEFAPEQYEAAAKKFEADGKFDLADLAKRKAEELRKNPPVKPADKTEADRKEWALKAGTDYPELTKANSAMQLRVAQLLKEEPEFKAHPKGIYVAARIAGLEADLHKAKADAAGLPKKDAELTRLTARVKELEALTAPGGEGGAQHLLGAKSFEQLSDSEQFAVLESQAREVGMLGR